MDFQRCVFFVIFSNVTFKMAAWRPYWIFWFPDSNFSLALNIKTSMAQYLCIWVGVYWFSAMCVLVIFSDVTFKMAAWRPYWIFGFRTLTLVWLWIPTPNFNGTILMHMGRSLLIFSDVRFCDILSVYWGSILFLPWVNSNKKTSTVEPLYSTIGGVHEMQWCYRRIVVK